MNKIYENTVIYMLVESWFTEYQTLMFTQTVIKL